MATITKTPEQVQSERRPRKVLLQLTDDEWRAVRLEAAHAGEPIQAIVTSMVLRDLSRRHRHAPQRWPPRSR